MCFNNLCGFYCWSNCSSQSACICYDKNWSINTHKLHIKQQIIIIIVQLHVSISHLSTVMIIIDIVSQSDCIKKMEGYNIYSIVIFSTCSSVFQYSNNSEEHSANNILQRMFPGKNFLSWMQVILKVIHL